MIIRNLIRNHVNATAIIIYIILFSLILFIKPNFLFNKDGSLRQFGLGKSKKTVIPVWLIAIILSVLSYFSVLYYLTSPKINL
jgi:quinol-cytochrome oxidoreductase complex cytochrome b subunit